MFSFLYFFLSLLQIRIEIIYFAFQSTLKMEQAESYLTEIREIRKIMEQSSRFLSLSGLSGILTGLYGLAGAWIAWRIIGFREGVFQDAEQKVAGLLLLGSLVLALALSTVLWLTYRKARRQGLKFWNPGSRLLCLHLALPLGSGGILILIFAAQGFYSIIAPLCLVFYGLALVNAARYTRREIFFMGLFETGLGILATLLPEWGLIFWAAGFGLIHLIYGTVMYFRYERRPSME